MTGSLRRRSWPVGSRWGWIARPHPEHPEGRNAQDGRDRRGHDDSQQQVEPEVGDAHLEDEHPGGVPAHPEEGGVPETGDAPRSPR